jgi:iron complex transport system substrate-binding protein
MKKRNKIFALSAVAVLIIASIVGVAFLNGKTQAKAFTNVSSIRLQVYGNANEDDTIDERDRDYIEGVIKGTNNETEFSDANYDGIVDSSDIDAVKRIINDEDTTIFYVNCDSNVASVHVPIETIVVAYSNNAEAIRVLKASDLVVGVDDNIIKYPVYFPEFQNRTNVGSRFSFDVEKILALDPDIVFTGTSAYYTPDLETKLAANGTEIDVVRLPTWEYNLIGASILTLGYILDREDLAYDYVKWHDGIVSNITTVVSGISANDKKNVFVDRPGSTTVAAGSGYAEVLEMGGGINIGKDLSGGFYPKVDTEWVIEQDPEYIVGISWSGSYESNNQSLLSSHYDEIVNNYRVTTAVTKGNVHIMHYDIMLGPSYVVGVSYIAKWLYPDLFVDLDPESIHQEYIDKFCGGLEYDVSEQGAFVL